jgi:hypothetical protein
VLRRRRLLMRRMDDQALAEREQAAELAGLEHRALAVLARHLTALRGMPPSDRHRFRRAPSVIASFSHGSRNNPASSAASMISGPADETYGGAR